MPVGPFGKTARIYPCVTTSNRPLPRIPDIADSYAARVHELLAARNESWTAVETVVADRKSARTRRFLRYLEAHPETRLVAQSGTLATRTIKDYAHLAEFALREGSPLPLREPVVEEWAAALDPGTAVAPPGLLLKLVGPPQQLAPLEGENEAERDRRRVRDAYRRWRNARGGRDR